MMRHVKELHGLDIVAIDGAIGSVEEVLISPISIGRADWNAHHPVAVGHATAGEGQSGRRYAQAAVASVRGRIPPLLRLSVLLGHGATVGTSAISGRRSNSRDSGDERRA